jgi:signal transduction histidine kinase
MLNHSLDRAAQFMEAARRRTIVINTLSRDLVTVTGILTMGNNARMNGAYDFFGKFINGYLDTLETSVNEIAPEVPADLSFDATAREILSLIHRQRAIFIKAEDKSTKSDELVVKLRRTSQWIKLCGRESYLLNKTLESAQAQFEQAVLAQKREQQLTALIVALALVANGLLACVLAFYFHRHIANRIGALVKMARKLPQNKQITEKIGGGDELAELASELGKVSLELSQTEDYRRTLMQMMAHDVRSPLMASSVSIEVLEVLKDGQLSDAGGESLNRARDSIALCLTLINDLLLLESLESGKLELDAVLNDGHKLVDMAIAREQQAASERSIQLINGVDDTVVRLDYDHILIALQKLLLNAIRQAPDKSQVQVTGSIRNGALRVCVHDCGQALSQRAREQIFDKFYQASQEPVVGNQGLGLAVVKEIVVWHGGLVGAESSESGNTVWFELPLLAETSGLAPTGRERGA